jgi:hypothetical protein
MYPLAKCKDMSVKQRGAILVALSEVQRHVPQWVVPPDSKRNIGQETKLTLWSEVLLQKPTFSELFKNFSPPTPPVFM